MPYLIQRRVRTSQPQSPVPLKKDSVLANKFIDIWVPSWGARSVVKGAALTVIDGGPVIEPGVSGISYANHGSSLSASSSPGYETGQSMEGTSACTLFSLFTSDDAPSGSGYGYPAGFPSSFNLSYHHPNAAFRNVFAIQIGSWHALAFSVPAANELLFWVGTYDGATIKAYENGRLHSSVSATSSIHDDAGTIGVLTRGAGGSPFNGRVFITGYAATAITAEDVAALYANPWQIFEDEEDYIWVPDVGGGYTATGAVPGSGSIVTGAATKTQVYSGSGAVAGTGATVTGAATRSFDSTGTVAGSGAIVTGSATNTQPSITSTGAVTGQGAIVSGAATRQFSSTGAVSGQGATVTGAATKTQVYSSTGAVVGGGAVVAGTATNTPLGISAYGDVAGQGSIVSGVATRTFSSTGAVIGQGATVAGTATRTFTATGAIAGYTAVITGAATNTPLGINGYGSVSGQGASVSGTATVTAVFTSTGAVVGSDATINGYATNVRVVTSSGVISGQGATVAGAATVSGITVWPLASDVRRGVVYGPNGIDYTGTLSVGTGTGGGMNVTLSEPRLSVVSRDNSVYVIHETQRKIFS